MSTVVGIFPVFVASCGPVLRDPFRGNFSPASVVLSVQDQWVLARGAHFILTYSFLPLHYRQPRECHAGALYTFRMIDNGKKLDLLHKVECAPSLLPPPSHCSLYLRSSFLPCLDILICCSHRLLVLRQRMCTFELRSPFFLPVQTCLTSSFSSADASGRVAHQHVPVPGSPFDQCRAPSPDVRPGQEEALAQVREQGMCLLCSSDCCACHVTYAPQRELDFITKIPMF